MTSRYAISDVASLVGEPSRAAMLLALLDGRALPAGELARAANLSAAATSLHLAKLRQGGLLTVQQEGRHRYYRLASSDVAHALESLGVLATAPRPRSLRDRSRQLDPRAEALRYARTCYDHLAGVVAVSFATLLVERGVFAPGEGRAFEVTPHGTRWFQDALGIDVAALDLGRRVLARRCLDWTERRPHVAGALGARILDRLVELRWVARTEGSRSVRVTLRGRDGLAGFGLRAAS